MKKQQLASVVIFGVLTGVLALGLIFVSYRPAVASDEAQVAQAIVDKAMVTFNDFMTNPKYVWFHENLNRAKWVLIFPEVVQGGLILGGSGGTGVLLVRDEQGNWSEPAFYTTASGGFGPLIGYEASEVIMVAMTQKAIDSLLSSSFEMGGDASYALGALGGGEKATLGVPDVNADFVAFAKTRGLYAGINLGGTDIKVRHNLDEAYYHAGVTPSDILVKKNVTNAGAAELRDTLKKAA